ncbi:MAG TPA: transglycosylase SLT domain-containing protein [Gemmatimonadaceae bacterium]
MRLSPILLGTIALAGCALHPNAAPQPARDDGVAIAMSKGTGDAGAAELRSRDSAATVIPAGAPTAGVTGAEVKRRVIEIFGDSLVLVPPPALDSADVDGPSWDMDVESYATEDRVAHYVQMFSGPARERIAARLDVGSRYEPMIRARMKAGGLPEDMYYLALIESGFNPNAYSKAAAVGMWQFMTSTARDMGMRVDWWVDERRDPVKSTGAAVRFIKGMKDEFGSLYLAAAAYNGGPGRVARGLARYADEVENSQGEDAFFVLADKDYLRNETREYVPQLIAAALIAKEPEKYGMTLHPQPPFTYDSVMVPAATPLAAIAKATGSSVAAIRELNPQILRGMTPPRVSYMMRIPVGTAEGFASRLDSLPDEDRVALKHVESRKGDTVDRLAERNHISSRTLNAFNPNLRRLRPSGRLVPGQDILIPSRAVALAALDVPDPAIEKYASGIRGVKTHIVKSGETVGGIALKYGTTTDRIMKLNGMKKSVIFPGQSLIVAGSGPSTKPTSHKSTTSHKSVKSRKSATAHASATAKKKSAKTATRKRSSR